jgi:hypothetical protein
MQDKKIQAIRVLVPFLPFAADLISSDRSFKNKNTETEASSVASREEKLALDRCIHDGLASIGFSIARYRPIVDLLFITDPQVEERSTQERFLHASAEKAAAKTYLSPLSASLFFRNTDE